VVGRAWAMDGWIWPTLPVNRGDHHAQTNKTAEELVFWCSGGTGAGQFHDHRVVPEKEGGRMKAAIGIDDWKLNTFTEMLENEGYAFEVNPGVTDDSLILFVFADDLNALSDLVFRMNAESIKRRHN
ncbi:MAG: hypothetical protein RQ767_05230, partial [Thermovirgaceae bacterium]|nr:hypothetical protein [Thermovirgaceae bacterium]